MSEIWLKKVSKPYLIVSLVLVAFSIHLMSFTNAFAEPAKAAAFPTSVNQAAPSDKTTTTSKVWEQSRADQNPIQRVLASGLMKGYPDGKFHPEGPVTRAELAHILVKTFKIDARQPMQFDQSKLTDVPQAHWAYDDVVTVLKAGVMEGYRPGRFYPNQVVTRGEAFAVFAQAYGVFNFDQQQLEKTLGSYKDANEVPGWAKKAMVTALHEGFVNANEMSGYIYPNRPMSRGDMAYALSKYLNRTYAEFPDTNSSTNAKP